MDTREPIVDFWDKVMALNKLNGARLAVSTAEDMTAWNLLGSKAMDLAHELMDEMTPARMTAILLGGRTHPIPSCGHVKDNRTPFERAYMSHQSFLSGWVFGLLFGIAACTLVIAAAMGSSW